MLLLAFSAGAALADGVGSATVAPQNVTASSTGNTLMFTFTAGETMNNGAFSITVPAGWTAPSTSSGAAGFSLDGGCALSGDIVHSDGRTVEVRGVFMSAGQTCTLTYGSGGGSTGATAPSATGGYQFTVGEFTSHFSTAASNPIPTAVPAAGSPTVQVVGDGSGTMGVAPTHAVAGSTANTLTFTYTPAGNMTSGEVDVAVPAGWTTPVAGGSGPGATTSTCGTVGVSGTTIQVTGVTKSSGVACTITFGNATAPGTGGAGTFTTEQKATSGGTLTTIASSPSVLVTAADGTGTMAVAPTTVIPGSSGNVLTFTYTAPSGGLNNGVLSLTVPAGWSAPTLTASQPGSITDGCGLGGHSLNNATRTFNTTGVTLAAGFTCTITYGASVAGGATAPTSPGLATFTTSEASWASGTLTQIASSPTVRVGNDGTGTMIVAPASATTGSTATLTFTYTAANAMSNGELTLVVPAGWSPPTAGSTSSTRGTAGVSGSTIQVTGVNASSNQQCTISYTGVAPSAPGTSVFNAQQESTSDNDLLPLTSSPSVAVSSPPAGGGGSGGGGSGGGGSGGGGGGSGGGSGSGGGGSGGGGGGATVASVTNYGLSSTAFPAAPSGPTIMPARVFGTVIHFSLSTPATVKFTVQKKARGHRKGTRCVAKGKGRTCQRTVNLGSFTIKGQQGLNRIRFTGRLKGHKLAPGSYTLMLVATDSAGQSKGQTRKFKIIR